MFKLISPQCFSDFVKVCNSVLIFLFMSFLVVGSVNLITTTILLLTIIVLPFLRPRYFLKSDFILFFSFLLFGLYHALHSYIFIESLTSGVEKYLKFLAGAFYFLVLVQYGYNKFAFFAGAFLGGVLSALFVIYEVFYNGYIGRVGLGHNPIAFSILMCFYAVSTVYFSRLVSSWFRYFLIVCSFFMVFASVYSGTRNAYLLYIVFFVYFMYLYKDSLALFFSKKIYRFSFILIFVFLSFLFVNMNVVEQRLKATFGELEMILEGDLTSSFGQRLQMWDAGIYLFRNNILFGHGSDRQVINNNLKDYYKEKNYIDDLMLRYSHFHNIFIDQLAKYGIIGLLLLIILFFSIINRFKNSHSNSLLIVFIIIFLVASLTDVPFNQNRTMMAFIIFSVFLSVNAKGLEKK